MSKDPWSELISLEEVLEVHKEGIDRYGGTATHKVDTEELIQAALGNAWSASLYQEPDGSVHGLCFTAYAVFYISNNHCFLDGNKRAGWLTGMRILSKNRMTVSATNDEAADFMLRVIENHVDQDGVLDWISERLEAVH